MGSEDRRITTWNRVSLTTTTTRRPPKALSRMETTIMLAIRDARQSTKPRTRQRNFCVLYWGQDDQNATTPSRLVVRAIDKPSAEFAFIADYPECQIVRTDRI